MTEEELEPYECVPHSLDNNSAHALAQDAWWNNFQGCLLYTSPSPRDS